jgi:hypothetical protein
MSREPLLEEYKKQNPLNYVHNAMSSLRPNTSQLTDKISAMATSIKNDNFVNEHVRDFKQDLNSHGKAYGVEHMEKGRELLYEFTEYMETGLKSDQNFKNTKIGKKLQNDINNLKNEIELKTKLLSKKK